VQAFVQRRECKPGDLGKAWRLRGFEDANKMIQSVNLHQLGGRMQRLRKNCRDILGALIRPDRAIMTITMWTNPRGF
jgi:hypothetical protein